MRKTTFNYTEPRDLEGTPFEAAGATARQAAAVIGVGVKALDDLFIMARTADMERQCQDGAEPDGAAFNESPLGKRLLTLLGDLDGIKGSITSLERGVSYDSRHPLKEN